MANSKTTKPKTSGKAAAGKPKTGKATAKKAAAKKAAAKKAAAKKTTVKKTAVKKTAVKKPSAKKTAAKKPTAKKAAAKKTTANKTTANKTAAKKTPAKRATTKKPTANKPTASKPTAKPPTDEVLSEIEDNLISYSYNFRSPATDREGKAWRKIAFSGPLKLLAKLVKHPVAQQLETLTIVGIDAKADKVIRVLSEGPPLAALRELRLGFLPEGQSDLVGFEERDCGDLTALSRACPRLEILRLLCPGFVAADHPTLRVLDARTGARPASVASLAKVSLPRLEELHLGFGVEDDEPLYASLIWPPNTLQPLLDGEALPTLRRLCLWPMPEDDGLFKLARASPLAKRVKIALRSTDDLEADTDAYTL